MRFVLISVRKLGSEGQRPKAQRMAKKEKNNWAAMSPGLKATGNLLENGPRKTKICHANMILQP